MPSNRCFLCDGSHLADECTTYRTLEEREHAVETLKLCLQCLQPRGLQDHVHLRTACNHCGKAHHKALCPLEPWRRGTTCAFCLGYHHSDACDKHRRIIARIRVVEELKICRRCLSRSHMEDGCTSTQRCKRCKEHHHHALCEQSPVVTGRIEKCKKQRRRRISMSPLREGPSSVPEPSREAKHVAETSVPNDTDEIEVIRVVHGSRSMPISMESSNEKAKQSSSSSEYQKQADKLQAKANEGSRELRLAKKTKHRAKRNRRSWGKERDDAHDKCKALEMKVHELEEQNRNCEAIRQVTAAAVAASIEIVTNREEERRRTIEKERDDAKKKLLEADKRIEALKEAARDAVRLTVEFQAWRIREVIKARKGGTPQKKANRADVHDHCTIAENVATTVQKAATTGTEEPSKHNARKRPATSSEHVAKRRKTDSAMPSADELDQKMDAVLGGHPEPVAEKYKLFFIENLRGSVTIDELVQFVRVRCPNDAGLAYNILQGFITSP